MDLKSTWTTLLDLNSFYDKLYLESKKIRPILLDFGLGLVKLINQAGMLLQKYEDFPWSNNVLCVINQMLMLLVAKLGIFCIQRDYSCASLVQFHLKGK